MATLRGYFDGSGESTDPIERVKVVGGCIATADEWDQLEPAWYSVLCAFKVREFKAAECNSRTNDFSGWSEDRRRDFLNQLAAVINGTLRNPSKPIAALLPLSEFHSLPPEKQQSWGNDPYFVCLEDCLTSVAVHATDLYEPPGKVAIWCDQETEEFELIASRVFRTCQTFLSNNSGKTLASFGFSESHLLAGLQVGDFVAYEGLKLRRAMIDGKDDLIDKPRWPLEQLLKMQCDFEFYVAPKLWEREPLADYSLRK